MNLKYYQTLVSQDGKSDGGVRNRLLRLGQQLRIVAQEAYNLGYSLEEIAAIDTEAENKV